MDNQRKKELLEAYKVRKPEMGVISFQCIPTGESFLGISKDTKADLNSNRFKLNANWHPNQRLQELWNQYGEAGFEQTAIKVLKYEDPGADHTDKLGNLLTQCLQADTNARRIWK